MCAYMHHGAKDVTSAGFAFCFRRCPVVQSALQIAALISNYRSEREGVRMHEWSERCDLAP